MNMTTMRMYCPSLKENVEATITDGKQVASKGGSLRNIIYGEFEGRKCLPKTVKADVFAQHGFKAESVIIHGEKEGRKTKPVAHKVGVEEKDGFVPNRINIPSTMNPPYTVETSSLKTGVFENHAEYEKTDDERQYRAEENDVKEYHMVLNYGTMKPMKKVLEWYSDEFSMDEIIEEFRELAINSELDKDYNQLQDVFLIDADDDEVKYAYSYVFNQFYKDGVDEVNAETFDDMKIKYDNRDRIFFIKSVDYDTDGEIENDELPQEFTIKITSEYHYFDEDADEGDITDVLNEWISTETGFSTKGIVWVEEENNSWRKNAETYEGESSPSSFDISWEDAQGVSSPSLPPEGIHFAEQGDYRMNGEGCEYCAETRELNAEGFCSECASHAESFSASSYEDAFFTETVSEMAAEGISRNGKLALSLTALGIGVAMALGSDTVSSLLDKITRK